jgi:hypothetical protein
MMFFIDLKDMLETISDFNLTILWPNAQVEHVPKQKRFSCSLTWHQLPESQRTRLLDRCQCREVVEPTYFFDGASLSQPPQLWPLLMYQILPPLPWAAMSKHAHWFFGQ